MSFVRNPKNPAALGVKPLCWTAWLGCFLTIMYNLLQSSSKYSITENATFTTANFEPIELCKTPCLWKDCCFHPVKIWFYYPNTEGEISVPQCLRWDGLGHFYHILLVLVAQMWSRQYKNILQRWSNGLIPQLQGQRCTAVALICRHIRHLPHLPGKHYYHCNLTSQWAIS